MPSPVEELLMRIAELTEAQEECRRSIEILKARTKNMNVNELNAVYVEIQFFKKAIIEYSHQIRDLNMRLDPPALERKPIFITELDGSPVPPPFGIKRPSSPALFGGRALTREEGTPNLMTTTLQQSTQF